MPTFYFKEETHTLASALRPSLEALCPADAFVSCTTPHPLDTFLEVQAPSTHILRLALLDVKQKIARARVQTLASTLPPRSQ